jgi:SET domain-containing protein
MSPNEIEQCRQDYLDAIREMGFTHAQVRAIVENKSDLTDMPTGKGDGLIVKPSPIDGLGTFAARDFRQGEVIAPARYNLRRTPAGRLTNHSQTPNSTMVALPDGAIDLVAACHIHVGDEFTVDYRQARSAAAKADGHISANIIKAIGGFDYVSRTKDNPGIP